VDECKPLPVMVLQMAARSIFMPSPTAQRTAAQGLTLAHSRAQLEHLREHIAHVRAQLEHLRDTSTD